MNRKSTPVQDVFTCKTNGCLRPRGIPRVCHLLFFDFFFFDFFFFAPSIPLLQQHFPRLALAHRALASRPSVKSLSLRRYSIESICGTREYAGCVTPANAASLGACGKPLTMSSWRAKVLLQPCPRRSSPRDERHRLKVRARKILS